MGQIGFAKKARPRGNQEEEKSRKMALGLPPSYQEKRVKVREIHEKKEDFTLTTL